MIRAEHIQVGYEDKIIIEDLSLHIHKGEIVSILGPNGCGKSTLLKTLSRIIKPKQGTIWIENNEMSELNSKVISKKIALLSQHNEAPQDITVKELIYYGRFPHKKWYEAKSQEDEEIVEWAMVHTRLTDYSDRKVRALSGGERQRVWLAMALAQKPEVLLLDEPTTYLDISHQLELMELIEEINKKLNMTIVMVLHDLNQASKYSDRLVIMKKGKIMSDGTPKDVINQDLIREIYNIQCDIDKDPINHKPRIHPIRTYKDKESIHYKEALCNIV